MKMTKEGPSYMAKQWLLTKKLTTTKKKVFVPSFVSSNADGDVDGVRNVCWWSFVVYVCDVRELS